MNNKELDFYIAKNCKHNYIDDYIDTMFPYREGIYIVYCEKCGLSKEYIEILLKPKEKNDNNK